MYLCNIVQLLPYLQYVTAVFWKNQSSMIISFCDDTISIQSVTSCDVTQLIQLVTSCDGKFINTNSHRVVLLPYCDVPSPSSSGSSLTIPHTHSRFELFNLSLFSILGIGFTFQSF